MERMLLLGCIASLLIFMQAFAEEEERPYPTEVTLETLADPDELARLEKPGEVFFREGFEGTEALEGWYNIIGKEQGRTVAVLDAELAHSGKRALQLRTVDKQGQASGAGATYWFHPGHDTVYFRRYIKFADDYDQGDLNHVGGSLYAIAGSDRWGHMGKAGIRPEGDDRFGSGFEPWRDWGRNDPPGAMMLYTYWMDMKRDKDGHYWGNNFMPPRDRQVVIPRGRWVCLEHMIKSGTPGKADGELAAWIDGKLYMHLKGFRWRSSPEPKPKRISLGLYVHRSTRPNMVWYDDVALSTGYVGPMEEHPEGSRGMDGSAGR